LTSLCFGAIIYTYTQTETVMEFAIEARNAKVQEFLASLMPSVIEQLGLTKSKRAVLVKVTNDNLEGMEGATLYIEFADCYLVLIKPAKRLTKTSLINMATTLAHEMVHVRQLAKGMLKYLPNESKIWMGKKFTKKTKYLDQPWELDAFARQEIILRKAIET
jgi:tRNA uridine 5-carbamoylmethylation protein Kti12